jgi:hypothetical protein
MKRIAAFGLCLLTILAGPSEAQTADALQIEMLGNSLQANGGEQPNVGTATGPIEIGKTTSGVIARRDDAYRCGLSVGPRVDGDPLKFWEFAVTPTRLTKDSVTFRLEWTRKERGQSLRTAEAEFTLKPGESMPIDQMPLDRTSFAMPSCTMVGMAFRVAVTHWPRADLDRRLVSTTVWLVEALPGGGERSQQLALRSPYKQPMPFYFTGITDRDRLLEILGEVTVLPGSGSSEVKLRTRRRLVEANGPAVYAYGNVMMSSIESTIRVAPGEVVSLELPKIGRSDADAFFTRSFSLRIKVEEVK